MGDNIGLFVEGVLTNYLIPFGVSIRVLNFQLDDVGVNR
jgi:hypothetical protein